MAVSPRVVLTGLGIVSPIGIGRVPKADFVLAGRGKVRFERNQHLPPLVGVTIVQVATTDEAAARRNAAIASGDAARAKSSAAMDSKLCGPSTQPTWYSRIH